MKKKFSIIDFFISISFVLLLSFYFLPQGIDFVINKKGSVSSAIKQEILLAGKKYLQNNKDVNSVSLSELTDSGYLLKNDTLYDKGCSYSISTVSKNNISYKLDLKCIGDESKLTLLE